MKIVLQNMLIYLHIIAISPPLPVTADRRNLPPIGGKPKVEILFRNDSGIYYHCIIIVNPFKYKLRKVFRID